ncbi:phage tail protein, partial [Escherichia coli]
WSLNDVVANFATRGSENYFVQIAQLQSGHYIAGVAGGTANALTLELPATFFVNGGSDWTLRTPIIVFPVQNNTNAATLQLTLGGKVLGTFPLYKGNKSGLVANDIIKGIPLICLLDSEKSYFSVINPGNIYSDFDRRYVKKSGDLMTGELKIRGVNALRIFNDAFGLIFRRSEECLHLIPTQENQGENGDIGPLRPFTISLRTGEVFMSHAVSVGGGSKVNGALGIGVQNALGGNSIAFGDNDTGIKQNGDGILDVYANGQHVFRFRNGEVQSTRTMKVSGALNVSGNTIALGNMNIFGAITTGQVIPSDYRNFDARYQKRNGGVQDVRYGSEMYYNPGGNRVSWIFRAPSGHGLSGIDVQETGSRSADNIGGVYYRPLQKLINGIWYNVASV